MVVALLLAGLFVYGIYYASPTTRFITGALTFVFSVGFFWLLWVIRAPEFVYYHTVSMFVGY